MLSKNFLINLALDPFTGDGFGSIIVQFTFLFFWYFLKLYNELRKVRIYPQKSKSLNLAFDVTPAKLVTGLITEKGVCKASENGLKGLFKWKNFFLF